MACGIYEIRNSIDNKVYVGRGTDIKKRFKDHERDLRFNRHGNKFLQEAWNTFGPLSFTFLLIKEVPKKDICRVEDDYIQLFNSRNREFGYNIKKGNPDERLADRQQQWVELISPEGKLVRHLGVLDFARTYGLEPASIVSRLISGQCGSFHGWKSTCFDYGPMKESQKIKNQKRAKTYRIINPNEEVIEITNLKKFAEENGLSSSSLNAVALGKGHSYKGWTPAPEFKKQKKVLGVKPIRRKLLYNNTPLEIDNLREFCRINNLDSKQMYRLINGKRESYKGYTRVPGQIQVSV